jgi:hypothetical protein
LLMGLCWYLDNPVLDKQSAKPVFANAIR